MKKFNQPILRSPGVLLKFLLASLFFLVMACSPNESENPSDFDEFSSSDAKISSEPGPVEVFASGIQGGSGSVIGPGGDLFVTEGAIGVVSRIDIKTGEISTFASGFPPYIIGIGGAMDITFVGDVAYVLVTLVGPQFGTDDISGIYRVDGPDSYTIVADLGQFSLDNPPETDFFVDMGVQYSIENYRGGFLVADGHHNRVLYVTEDGEISVFEEFGNIVPTGLDVSGKTVYMSQAGPVPHEPEDGKIVTFGPNSSEVSTIANGARLLVDVEFGRGRTLFALSQGVWDGVMEGSPAFPNTGSLVEVNDQGGFDVIVEDLDRPTSLEIVKNTAYIVTLTGEVLKIDNIASEPFGK